MIKENIFLVLALVLGFVGIAIFKTGIGYYFFILIACISALAFMFYSVKKDFKNIINRFKDRK